MNVYMSYDEYCKSLGVGIVALATLALIGWGLNKLGDYLAKH